MAEGAECVIYLLFPFAINDRVDRENLQVPGVSWMTLKVELSALEYRHCQQLARTEADKPNRSARSHVLT